MSANTEVTLNLMVSGGFKEAVKMYAARKKMKLKRFLPVVFLDLKNGKIIKKFEQSSKKEMLSVKVSLDFRKNLKSRAANEDVTMSYFMENILLKYMENNP